MTILIDTMKNAATSAAVKRENRCLQCNGHGCIYVGEGRIQCDRCRGYRKEIRVAYHYVGRAMPRQGVKASALGNPYRVGKDGTAAECLEKYGKWLHNHMLLMLDAYGQIHYQSQRVVMAIAPIVSDLKAGCTVVLVCWCAKCQREPYDNPADHDDGCHADIIAKLVKETL